MNRLSCTLTRIKARLLESAGLICAGDRLPWLIIVVGVVLRLRQYLFNRSLWLDESFLALNIVDRSLSELVQPLDYSQGAPVGFLMLEKLAVQAFGNSDYVLRLLPFLSGTVALFLFYKVARRCITPESVPIALGLFALSEPLIYYSSEVKQYSSDVAIALLLLYAVIGPIQSGNLTATASRVAFWGILGAIAIWLSHPSVFVLAGGGASLILFDVTRSKWARIRRLSMTYLLWASSFVACYFVSLRGLGKNDLLLDYWDGAFMPFLSVDFSWYINAFFGIFEHSAGLSLSGIAALTFLVGFASLFSRKRETLLILLSPVFLALLASGFHRYPFRGRFLLFAVPSLLFLVAEGVQHIKNHSSAVVRTALVGLLFFHPLYLAGYHLVRPHTKEETRPAINYVRERIQDGDVLHLYHASQYAFKYYAARYGFDDDDYVVGVDAFDWGDYVSDLDKLGGEERVWILFSHIQPEKEKCFLTHLDSMGTRLDAFESTGSAVYLYDLGGEASER